MLIGLHPFQSTKNSECNFSTANRHIASLYKLWLIVIFTTLWCYTVHLTWGKNGSIILWTWLHWSAVQGMDFFTQARDWHILRAPNHRIPSQQEVSRSYYLNIFRYFTSPSPTSSRSHFYFSASYRLLTTRCCSIKIKSLARQKAHFYFHFSHILKWTNCLLSIRLVSEGTCSELENVLISNGFMSFGKS